jgi:hypothetical protein
MKAWKMIMQACTGLGHLAGPGTLEVEGSVAF